MRPLTRLEAAAVKGKRARLEECLELFGDQGRVLVELDMTQLVSLGFSVREAGKVQRLRAALRVLQNFKPVLVKRAENWAVRDEALKNGRLVGNTNQTVMEHEQRDPNSMWEAYLVDCWAR